MREVPTQAAKLARSRWLALDESNPLIPYLYLLPHALLFAVFVLYPVGFGLYVSLHRWHVLSASQPFVGLEHYKKLFTPGNPHFEFFWRTLLNILIFVGASVPLLVAVALGLALLLRRPIWGRAFFRTVFFMPTILSVSVVAILFRWLFENQSGLVNLILQDFFGLRPIPFLTTEGWAWVPIVASTLWWTVGFNMVLYTSALAAIPGSYYEAAALDGAGSWAQFRFITWPLLTPVTLFVAVTTTLASFQLFGQSQLITAGGPNHTTQSVIMYITEEAFGRFNFSVAAAMSFLFGLLLLIFTTLQFRLMVRDLGRESR